jgi:hypothetical protein
MEDVVHQENTEKKTKSQLLCISKLQTRLLMNFLNW